MTDGTDGHRGPELGDQLADAFVYAPLGLVLEARRLLPELAARGRRQVLFTRTIGKYAVGRGRAHLDDLIGTGVGLVGAWLPFGGPDETLDAEDPVVGPATPSAPAATETTTVVPDHLAIPDYDSLSAFQVVPRLEALDPADLDDVRAYKEATRGRRTILNKIAQLG